MCNSIGTSAAMQKLGTKRFKTKYPGCEEFNIDDDGYYNCLIRSTIMTIYHPVGTAKMGNPEDPTTVVDPQLK